MCNPNEIVRLMRAGDMEALERLTHCYGTRLLAAGRRYCGDEDRAQDAVQDTLLAAGSRLSDFRGDGSVEGWLVRMVANFCRRSRRGRKNDPGLHLDVELAAPVSAAPSPEDDAARGQLLLLLGEALESLPTRDRAMLLLADAEDWKAPEIAKELGMTPAAVRTRLSRARRKLREGLGPLREFLPAE